MTYANFANVIRTVVFIIAFGICINAVWAEDERSIKKLSDALVALAPDVDPGEAELVSVTAHTASRSLAREYRVVWCAGFQNILINTGRRQRGFCGHYTRDIGERLRELKVKTLVLHWGAAFAGTLDENNGLKTASSWMAGVMAVDYSGAHSKTILRTIYACIPHDPVTFRRVGPDPAIPGPRHG